MHDELEPGGVDGADRHVAEDLLVERRGLDHPHRHVQALAGDELEDG
jgi:hypothetical protein